MVIKGVFVAGELVPVLESDVEGYLRRRVKSRGGFVEKWASGWPGAPDRIMGIPVVVAGAVVPDSAKVVFVEVKSPTGPVRPKQARRHQQMRAMGLTVRIVSTKAEVDVLVDEFFPEKNC